MSANRRDRRAREKSDWASDSGKPLLNARRDLYPPALTASPGAYASLRAPSVSQGATPPVAGAPGSERQKGFAAPIVFADSTAHVEATDAALPASSFNQVLDTLFIQLL